MSRKIKREQIITEVYVGESGKETKVGEMAPGYLVNAFKCSIEEGSEDVRACLEGEIVRRLIRSEEKNG